MSHKASKVIFCNEVFFWQKMMLKSGISEHFNQVIFVTNVLQVRFIIICFLFTNLFVIIAICPIENQYYVRIDPDNNLHPKFSACLPKLKIIGRRVI